MGEIRTKDEPKNAKSQNVRFIKIDVSFSSLIPCLILPTDDRENTERTPRDDREMKKWLNLKKVDSISKKVVPFPEKFD